VGVGGAYLTLLLQTLGWLEKKKKKKAFPAWGGQEEGELTSKTPPESITDPKLGKNSEKGGRTYPL